MSFSLNKLRSELLVGEDPGIFKEQVESYLAEIDAKGPAIFNEGVLIAEEDPVLFVAAFLAALEREAPIILGNAHWGQIEWASFDRQFSPVLAFGRALNLKARPSRLMALEKGLILIPTGGSTTQELKFTQHQWVTLENQSKMVQSFLNTNAINSICALPLFHVSGLMQIVRALVTGGQIFLTNLKPSQSTEFGIALEDYCLSLVPTQLTRLLEEGKFLKQLVKLKCIFIGGAAINTELLQRAVGLQLPIVTSYGMTETAGLIAVEDHRLGKSDLPCRSYLLPDVRISLELSEGLKRIRIFSKSLFQGYWGGPKFEPAEGFLTSDYGALNPEGGLVVEGRLDRVIISGGEKIFPQEVENALVATGQVSSALVVGQHSTEWGESVIAIVTAANDTIEGFNPERLAESLKGSLASYKRPKNYITVKKLPLLNNEKPDKRLIAELLSSIF